MKKITGGFLALIVAFAFAGVSYAGDADNGASLWKSKKCKNCHKMSEKKKVGPGLAGVTGKRSEAWMKKWLADPQAVWEENDAETQELRKWKKGADTAKKTKMKIKKLSDSEIDDLIAYMKANGG